MTDLKQQKKSTTKNLSKEQILAKVFASIDIPKEKDSRYKFTLLDNLIDIDKIYRKFAQDNPSLIAVDTETQGLKWTDKIIGLSFSWSDSDNYYIPFRHECDDHQMDIEDCRDILNDMFGHESKKYVFHNYKFDYHKLKKDGIVIGGEIHDTMLMHYVLDENESHSLKNLAARFIDEKAHEYEKIIADIRRKLARSLKIKLKDFGFEHIPIDIMVEYACRDTLYTLKLFEHLLVDVVGDSDIFKVYLRELDLLPVLCYMEEEGVYVDQNILIEKSNVLGDKLEVLKGDVWGLAGVEFDLNSPTQIASILQQKGIHTFQYTPKGKMSTDAKALKGISGKFPFIAKLLEYRDGYKTKYTYTDPLRGHCDDRSYIHCSYMQAVAVTGRLTCKNPSLQVIPRSTGIRNSFVPPGDEYIIVPIDLSQVELRMTAHYSNDKILMHAYTYEEDIHTRTAAEIFDIDLEDVSKEQRTIAKPINFGIIYGIGPTRLAETLSISVSDAKHYIERYLERYAGVAKFIEKYKRIAKKEGFVKNYFGRVRHLNHLKDSNIEEWRRERSYRQAVNFVIQSSSADMFKIILIRCHKLLTGTKSKMVMNIHDECVFYIHKDELSLILEIKKAFEDWNFKVPIIAEVSWSDVSWGDKKTLEL